MVRNANRGAWLSAGGDVKLHLTIHSGDLHFEAKNRVVVAAEREAQMGAQMTCENDVWEGKANMCGMAGKVWAGRGARVGGLGRTKGLGSAE